MQNFTQPEPKPRGRPPKARLEIEETALPAVESAVHSEPCAFIVARRSVKSVSGDMIVEEDVCGAAASVRALLQFTGARRDETFPRSKVYRDHLYKWHLDCGPVCEEHRKAVRRDFGALLSNARFADQIKSFTDQGFPVPDEKQTRLSWRLVEAPPVQNEYRTQIPEVSGAEGDGNA